MLEKLVFMAKESGIFFALYLDTGAAANLSGDQYLKSYWEKVLNVHGYTIVKRPSKGSFSGISGQPLRCTEVWEVPIFPGYQVGEMEYEAHVIDTSDLPPLLSSEAMQSQGCILDLKQCFILIPVEDGVYQVWPIKFNGYHFMWPIMHVNCNKEPVYCKFGRIDLKKDNMIKDLKPKLSWEKGEKQEETAKAPQAPEDTWKAVNASFESPSTSSTAPAPLLQDEVDSEDELEAATAKCIMFGQPLPKLTQ